MDGYKKLSLAKCDWAPGEILDNAGVRHCIVGDLIVVAVGYPLVPFDFQFAIADEQLETARSALASGGYQEVPQTHQRFFDRTATNESTTGWPGYRFLPNDADDWTTSIIIVPAKFWHLDLSRDAWSRDTFLFPNSPCRFPRRLVYFRAIIDIVADRYSAKGLNTTITDYFECHYVYLLSFVKDIIAYLPDEDQFFVELFRRVIMRHVRQKVCFQRQQIRAGIVTPEEARALIPRPDLKLAAIKQKYRDRADSMLQEGHDIEHPKGIGPSTTS
ncbi:conserved hypothetical protein [Histoplasma capsulatum G186AR]|uniref:Uncharacterized protein n=2 Tax=Ajellomyces capsulatus TaxID=5037 RepID=C0NY49_AJECG|nr:uncharacterized protein HCBG_07843 [Histoplasma capsulatum G186AR]EEH03717.1 conserved hypothetical protein [Histoplasma capsulatum G186AR]